MGNRPLQHRSVEAHKDDCGNDAVHTYFWFGKSSVVSASSATMARKSRMFPVEIFLSEKWFMQKTIQFGHTRGPFADNFKAIAVIWRGKHLYEKAELGRLLRRKASVGLIHSALRAPSRW